MGRKPRRSYNSSTYSHTGVGRGFREVYLMDLVDYIILLSIQFVQLAMWQDIKRILRDK